jgi:hypothetical protein
MRSILIVSEIEVQVARDPELNPGNHMPHAILYNLREKSGAKIKN